jgi:signal transduction histidine kinase/ligand-binding sensor domain-containing protein/ActR/RegA family two-component response regulator
VTALRSCAAAILWIAILALPAGADDLAPRDDVPPGQLTFRVFAGVDGLRNLVISSIVQDGDGFLWIGTDDGVYRFDGEQFTHFSIAEGLTSSEVFVVGLGPAGEVCIGSAAGLVCRDGARFSQARTRGLPPVPVHAIASFAGKLWVGTDGAGLYVGDAGGELAPAPGWSGSRRVLAMWADRDGLVVGRDATVQITAGDGTWRSLGELVPAAPTAAPDPVEGVLRDRRGALWIRTPSHLWVLPRGATRAMDLHAGLPSGQATAAMVIGPRGEVLLGTDSGIAYRDDERWRLLDHTVGMPWASTRTLFVDREGTIWIGGAGLAQLRGRGLVEHHNLSSGLPGDDVWAFRRDLQGTLWIGTSQCLTRAHGGRWECLPGTEGRTVRSFVFPPQGGVFAGGAPSDLLYIDPHGRATSVGDPPRGPARTILALALGPEGDLWIAGDTGMDRLPGAVPGPIEHVAIPGTHADDWFASLLVSGPQLWTAGEHGVAVHDRGTWHVFDQSAGFRSSALRYIIQRADGRFCASYDQAIGVTCFRYAAGQVSALEHIGPAEGLAAGMVYFLGEDRRRRLWIGTGAGVDVVTSRGIDHFDQSDGLAGDDSTATAFLIDRDGSLWLGASGGATHLFAQHYDGPLAPPRTAFLEARLGGTSLLDARTAPELPHDHNALNLEFASSSMLGPRQLEYQVRLSPTETEWRTTHQRQIHDPALPPGSYRFEARTRIGSGSWGPIGDLRFTILPAWWQTRWFLALSVLAGLALIGAGFAWRQRAVLRRRTRQLHQRSDESFRSVLDVMPELISVYRAHERVYLNAASRRFLGIDGPGDRRTHVRLLDRVHPDDRVQFGDLFRNANELAPQLTTDVVEVQVRAADDSWRICEISAIRVEIGGAPTVVFSGRDVTERKRMRAKLLVSDRMASLGTLAAGIAHEINNPLAYVTGNLEAMAEALQAATQSARPADCHELSAVVRDARDGADRVRKIVHGLRSFSRSSDQEQRTALAIGDVLEAALRLTGNEIRHRAQLVRELGPVPLVMADDGRLTQVFINLLVNAAQAIPEGHSDQNRITARTRTDEHGRAVIEVIDTGEGMAPEVQARVFDPFFTTKDIGEGTGLGLSICHGIVTSLGGQISIDSAPGRGTVIRVALPPHTGDSVPEAAPAATGPGAPAAVARRHNVMVVDDEPMIAHTMERLLRRDYDITVALCGRDAIEQITRGARFDAIVSDVMMPNMTGIELTEELQRVAPDQARRLIFLSGGAFTAQTRARLDELGAPQLEKPVTAKELRACVQRVVSEAPPPLR